MVFSKRERVIIAATVVALSALVVDRLALTPLLDQRAAVQARKASLLGDMERTESLLKRRRLIGPRWRRMLAEGMTHDPAEAESQVLHALGKWSAEAGLNLSSLRPERSTEESSLPEINLHVAGTGSMAAVSRFLWRLETAAIPLKVKVLQLASRKEGTDALSLQMQVSTLYLPSGPSSPSGDEEQTVPAGGVR